MDKGENCDLARRPAGCELPGPPAVGARVSIGGASPKPGAPAPACDSTRGGARSPSWHRGGLRLLSRPAEPPRGAAIANPPAELQKRGPVESFCPARASRLSSAACLQVAWLARRGAVAWSRALVFFTSAGRHPRRLMSHSVLQTPGVTSASRTPTPPRPEQSSDPTFFSSSRPLQSRPGAS